MADSPLRYAVLLQKPEYLQTSKVAEALAAYHKIHPSDAAPKARATWGIVAENMEEAEAKALSDKLSAAGLGGIALPGNLLEEPPAPMETSRVEFDAEGIRFLSKAAERSSLSWSRIAVIAAIGFKQVQRKTIKAEGPTLGQKAASLGIMMVTGLPIHIGGKKSEPARIQESSEIIFYLDIYERKPLRRLRIDAQDFNYSCLGEKMQYSSPANFKILVEHLSKSAPTAVLNRGARCLKENQPIGVMGYEGLADLDRESRWLLTLESLRNP